MTARPPETRWFDRLYQDHFREILVFVKRKVGEGPPDPEDVTQHAFEKIATHPKPETIENKRAFLYRTAANFIVSFRRHAAVERRHAAEDASVHEIFGESDGISPERVLLDREQFGLVLEALQKLPHRRRRLLLLNRVEGLSFAALARRYKVSETTVRRQIAAAMEELAKYAPAYEPDDDDPDDNDHAKAG